MGASVQAENVGKIRDWLANRGGVAVWKSVNLSNPGASWLSPALDMKGRPIGKPTWQAANTPAEVITDARDIDVIVYKEVKRIKIATRLSGNGLTVKLTNASSERLWKALDKAGDGAIYRFEDREAVILIPVLTIPLPEWEGQNEIA